MIIISQDKRHVINSDNVKDFRITYLMGHSSNQLESDKIEKVFIDADDISIAEFDNEKDAMETLNELATVIVAGNKDYVIH